MTYIVVRPEASVLDALVASETLTGYCARATQLPAPTAAATAVAVSDGSGAVVSLAQAPASPVRSTAICRRITALEVME